MIKITKSNLDYNFYIIHPNSNYSNDNDYVEENNKKYLVSKFTGECIEVINDNLSSYFRAKNTIRDYAKNNHFNYFLTITIDDRKFDISNELALKKKLLKHFNNFKNRYDKDFKYIIVAERGKKTNRLHFHGLVLLNNKECLKHIGAGRYRDSWLFDNFGANLFVPIKTFDIKVVNYISKYITKDSYLSHIYKFNYFCSNGLKRSKTIFNSSSEFSSLDPKVVETFISWLNDNNLIESYQFCDYCSVSCSIFEEFLKTHHLDVNDLYIQLSFNDVALM